MPGKRVVARARALIGIRFALHGRDVATGIDCVGLILIACPVIVRSPVGYALRGGSAGGFAAMFVDNRLTRRRGNVRAGDILLLQPSPAQFHLGIWSGEGLIHADAILRRVVETPGSLMWPLVSAWHGRKRRKR